MYTPGILLFVFIVLVIILNYYICNSPILIIAELICTIHYYSLVGLYVGGSREISTIYAIKDQVYFMENTVQWLVNTYSYFNFSLKITAKKHAQSGTKGIIWNHCSLCNWCLTVGCFMI